MTTERLERGLAFLRLSATTDDDLDAAPYGAGMTEIHCEVSPADFDATVVETSDARIVRVMGRGVCPTPGWRVELVAAAGGVDHRPETIVLELRETPPRESRSATRSRVSFEAMIEGPRAREVVVRFAWREGITLPLRGRVRSFA
ncbi:hypothetical protein [Agromyces humatus]|uniref:Uncharacterized protein n=1 Tax=Agromyces humatus TaxID=279573 RepID=A0ABN2KK71_9MICO|nr:hypothetical protein [Agromyces humatus]